MTVIRLLRLAKELSPSTFSDDTLLMWISQVENILASDVAQVPPEELMEITESTNAQMLVPHPFDRVYLPYVQAQIAYAQGETDLYQNYLALYNAYRDEWIAWVRNGKWRHSEWYLSAYNIAVEHGYSGTIDEWLHSLTGEKGEKGDSVVLLGSYATLDELMTAHPVGHAGDYYAVGVTPDTMLAYYWDPEVSGWRAIDLVDGQRKARDAAQQAKQAQAAAEDAAAGAAGSEQTALQAKAVAQQAAADAAGANATAQQAKAGAEAAEENAEASFRLAEKRAESAEAFADQARFKAEAAAGSAQEAAKAAQDARDAAETAAEVMPEVEARLERQDGRIGTIRAMAEQNAEDVAAVREDTARIEGEAQRLETRVNQLDRDCEKIVDVTADFDNSGYNEEVFYLASLDTGRYKIAHNDCVWYASVTLTAGKRYAAIDSYMDDGYFSHYDMVDGEIKTLLSGDESQDHVDIHWSQIAKAAKYGMTEKDVSSEYSRFESDHPRATYYEYLTNEQPDGRYIIKAHDCVAVAQRITTAGIVYVYGAYFEDDKYVNRDIAIEGELKLREKTTYDNPEGFAYNPSTLVTEISEVKAQSAENADAVAELDRDCEKVVDVTADFLETGSDPWQYFLNLGPGLYKIDNTKNDDIYATAKRVDVSGNEICEVTEYWDDTTTERYSFYNKQMKWRVTENNSDDEHDGTKMTGAEIIRAIKDTGGELVTTEISKESNNGDLHLVITIRNADRLPKDAKLCMFKRSKNVKKRTGDRDGIYRRNFWSHPADCGDGDPAQPGNNDGTMKYGYGVYAYQHQYDIPSWMPNYGYAQTEWPIPRGNKTAKVMIDANEWTKPMKRPFNPADPEADRVQTYFVGAYKKRKRSPFVEMTFRVCVGDRVISAAGETIRMWPYGDVLKSDFPTTAWYVNPKIEIR